MKRSYGLPKGASSALVHEDVESFGLGSESLSVAYAKLHASHLVEDQWQVPCAFLQPLLGLDLNRLEDLTEPGGTHVIDGRHHKDKARKKQSLHREAVKANDVGVRQPTVDCCPCQNHS